jgi:L-rhamnose isomerase
MNKESINEAYQLARDRYQEMGVNADEALQMLAGVPISLHCWQGDDVGGFESQGEELGGGLAVTGNYPGKARTPEELRADAEKALSLIPGRQRFSLHASYAEFGGRRVERNELTSEHFRGWIDWAKSLGIGLDFNATYFAHPKAADGFTLAHPDHGIRRFWIEHGQACRRIGAAMGREQGTACVTNFWVPDGYKDTPIDRKTPRGRLAESLDAIFADPVDPRFNLDAVEGKLFGLGAESYTAGSHDFYLGYAIQKQKLLCLDMGHYHPTESVADKISSVLMFVPEILLHVSRGVRWDSDHVVVPGDDLETLAQELVRGDFLGRTHIGLDFFDATINRVAAWVIGTRSVLKALLQALAEPTARLREYEQNGDFTARLAMLQEVRNLPLGSVWDYYCLIQDVPPGAAWLDEVKRYEREVTSLRV